MTGGANSAPFAPCIGNGAAGQNDQDRGKPWGKSGAPSLKALANKVLEREQRGNPWGSNGASLKNSGASRGADQSRDGWTAKDWRGYFNERAGIVEYDGGQDRTKAEAQAFQCCLVHWLTRNPPQPGQPNQCIHCGQPEQPSLPLLAIATKQTVWVHDRCMTAWREARQTEAKADLAQVGIKP